MDFRIQINARLLCMLLSGLIVASFAVPPRALARMPLGKLSRARAQTDVPKSQKPEAQKSESKERSKPKREPKRKSKPSGKLAGLSAVLSASSSKDKPRNEHRSRDRGDNHNRISNRGRRGAKDHGKHRRNRFFASVAHVAFAPQPVLTQTVVEHHYLPQPALSPAYANVDPVPVEAGADYFEVPHGNTLVATRASRQQDGFHDWLTQVDLNVGSDFDGLDNAGIGFRFQIPNSFGIDTDISYFRESIGDFRDHSWLGDFNLVYEPIVTSRFRLRFGVGVNWLTDDWGSASGFNLTSSMDWRLNENWIFQAEGDIGELGDADYAHGRVQLLRNLGGGAAIAVGYESYDIGGVKLNSAFTGLQFRY